MRLAGLDVSAFRNPAFEAAFGAAVADVLGLAADNVANVAAEHADRRRLDGAVIATFDVTARSTASAEAFSASVAADLEGAADADFAEALDAEAAATGDAGAQAAAASLEEVLDVDAAPYEPPTPSPTAEGEKKKTKRRILGLPGQLALVLFAAAVALIGICGCWYACAGSGEEPERTSSPDVELNDVYKQPKKTTREVV